MSDSNDFLEHQGVTLVVLWAGVLGCIVVPVYSLLNLPKSLALTTGVILFIVMVALGLMTLGTDMPEKCFLLEFDISNGLIIFPITLVGAGVSLFGLAVSLSWCCTKSKTDSGMAALVYFVLASLFNISGVIGVMKMSCDQDRRVGFPFYGTWIVSSFLTNLGLHKIVAMLAALDAHRVPCIVRGVFLLEVAVALLLVTDMVYLSVSAAIGDDGDPGHSDHEMLHDLARVFCIILVAANLLFYSVCLIAMRKGLKSLQLKFSSQPIAHEFGQSSCKKLADAVFFSKVNILMVVLSMLTSSLFYVCFIVTMPMKIDLNLGLEGSVCLFMSWLLESLFIDLCVIFFGYGPTANNQGQLAPIFVAYGLKNGAAAKAETTGVVAASEVVGCAQLSQSMPETLSLPPSLPAEPLPPFVPSSVPPSLLKDSL